MTVPVMLIFPPPELPVSRMMLLARVTFPFRLMFWLAVVMFGLRIVGALRLTEAFPCPLIDDPLTSIAFPD